MMWARRRGTRVRGGRGRRGRRIRNRREKSGWRRDEGGIGGWPEYAVLAATLGLGIDLVRLGKVTI
jgi:hypothetical protein